jgi:16S rRNA (adenine(1408)-N(1))-methyltransferase
VAIDIGTGDGRAVVARAAAEPRTLVIGFDANAAAMADASRRASRAPARDGLPNALFVVAAAEAPPGELIGLADLLTIVLPWGSLLDGVLGCAPHVTAGIASLVRPGGTIEVLISLHERDGRAASVLDDRTRHGMERAWAAAGIALVEVAPATVEDVARTRSSWARRLRIGRDRDAWRLVLGG